MDANAYKSGCEWFQKIQKRMRTVLARALGDCGADAEWGTVNLTAHLTIPPTSTNAESDVASHAVATGSERSQGKDVDFAP